MNKVAKFLLKLSKKDRDHLRQVLFPKIRRLALQELGAEKMSGFSYWKIRYRKIRIIFCEIDGKGFILSIGYRGDVYKNIPG